MLILLIFFGVVAGHPLARMEPTKGILYAPCLRQFSRRRWLPGENAIERDGFRKMVGNPSGKVARIHRIESKELDFFSRMWPNSFAGSEDF